MRPSSVIYILAIYIFPAVVNDISGQNENSLWLLHENIQISFASGTPQASQQASHIPHICENSVVVCDENGDLLFYTFGKEIWNKDNQIIKNGEDLGGNKSTSQGTVVVRSENIKSTYHIFTLENIYTDDGSSLYYSVLDMEGNNGNGEIIQKPMEIWTNLTEKMVGISHPCGGSWIIVHERGNDHFLSFHLENDHINPIPVVSVSGAIYDSKKDPSKPSIAWVGDIVKSFRNDLLAVIGREGLFEIVSFDDKTGIVSNSLTIHDHESSIFPFFQGSFSESGEYFYLIESSTNKGQFFYNIVQYSLHHFVVDSIRKSRQIVGSLSQATDSKRMADGKIYLVSGTDYHSIHRIEFPNNRGSACHFQPEYLDVGTEIQSFNLPQDLIIPIKKTWFALPEDTTICAGAALRVDLTHIDASFSWSDGQTQAVRSFQSPGTYMVQAIDPDGCTYSDTMIVDQIDPENNGMDTTLCPGDFLVVEGDTIDQAGQHAHTIYHTEDCAAEQIINLDFYDIEATDTLYAHLQEGNSFLWHDALYDTPGLYNQTIIDSHGCNQTIYLSLDILPKDDILPYIPNAFTPNGDGINDEFAISLPPNMQLRSFTVFDRWGGKRYETSGEIKWKPQNHESGVYMYLGRFENILTRETITKSGTINVIR